MPPDVARRLWPFLEALLRPLAGALAAEVPCPNPMGLPAPPS